MLLNILSFLCNFEVCSGIFWHIITLERFELKGWQNNERLNMYIITQYHMESTLYGIYALLVFVSVIEESAQQTSEIDKNLLNFKQEKIYIFLKK